MADTIREQIIHAYLTRLSAWTTANGFNYGCGGTIKRAELPNIEDMPAVVLWPGEEYPEIRYNEIISPMTLKFEAMAPARSIDNKSVIQEKLIGDLIKILTDPQVEVSALMESATITKISPADPQNPEDTLTAAVAELAVRYATVTGDPYSQEQ